MKKNIININDLLLYISLTLLFCVALIRPYLSTIFKINGISLYFIIIALLLLLFNVISKKIIKVRSKEFIIISFILIIVSLYNNAYIQASKYVEFLTYIFTILYFTLFNLAYPNKKIVKYSMLILLIFSIVTSITTWIGYIYPDFYRDNIIKLLPNEAQQYVLRTYKLVNPGLTSHYSRNAFFVVLGIMSSFYFYFDKKNKWILIIDIFLLATLFAIGKRGHLIFLILSFLFSLSIYKKVSIKNIIRLIGIVFLLFIVLFAIVKNIPYTDFVFNRMFENNEDFSTGRVEMYRDAITLYKDNGYFPIGWGQYSKSTSFTHPALHNDYLQLFIEVGFLGLLIVIGSNIIFYKKSIQYCKLSNDPFGFVALMYNIFVLIYSLTGLPHYDIESYIMYFFINSMLYVLLCQKKEMKTDES